MIIKRQLSNLKFDDPEAENAYLLDYAQGLSTQATFGVFLALALYIFFAFLDLYIVPENLYEIWSIRIFVTISFAIVLIAIHSKIFIQYNQFILSIAALVCMGGLFVMYSIISPTAEGRYYVALMLVIPWMYVTLGLRTKYAFYLNVFLLLIYNIETAYFRDYPTYLLLNNNYFLFGASCISMMGGYLIESKRRTTFAANKSKSQFYSNVSHEFRTPLNVILGYSQLLLNELSKAEKKRLNTGLLAIESASDHLLKLVDDILDIAKIDAGKIDLHIQETSLSNLLDQLKTTAIPLALKNKNNLIVNIPDASLNMYTDEMKLMQILLNLISNACKFTKQGDVIVNAIEKDGYIKFIIQDTGVGMTKEQTDKIFMEFQQAEISISGAYGGTGLGLTISKQFANLMGGDISVTSELDKGSVFTVTLPINI